VTAAWQAGRVSNFDYLLYLNLAAGRSFNDLAQWPVFPWVLSNYVTQVFTQVATATCMRHLLVVTQTYVCFCHGHAISTMFTSA
jgi:hypothetical protein